MRKEKSKKHFIPIIDCLGCGHKDVPLSTIGPFIPRDDKLQEIQEAGRALEIWISYCPVCDRVPLDESEIKGYVSLRELKQMGWREATKFETWVFSVERRLLSHCYWRLKGLWDKFMRLVGM